MENQNNVFKKIYNNVKSKINNAVLENKIESKFKESNVNFTLYTLDNMFPISLSGYYENDEVILYSNYKIPKYSVLVNEGNKKTYYILNVQDTDVKITVDDIEYKRKGKKVLLDKNVEEVQVIKAGKKYYKYKG